MTKEEKEQIGKYILQMARLLEDGCDQQKKLLKAVHIIDEAIPKDQYEARLKADMVAMLEKLVLELYESYENNDMVRIWYIREFIQYRIDKLKEEKE